MASISDQFNSGSIHYIRRKYLFKQEAELLCKSPYHYNNSNIINKWCKMEKEKTQIKSLLFELSETLADTTEVEKLKSVVSNYIKEPFKVPTPESKVKKRPDGFDYVESSWMDISFKANSPLYDNNIVYVNDDGQWVDIIVRVTDKITGNTELGGGSAKIQVAKSTGKVLDKGNNLTAALSKAIKNAQSRFGHAADVYHKRHELPTDDEKERYESMLTQIKDINSTRAYTFSDQWDQLGTGFGDYLDRWQTYIERNINKKSSLSEGSNNQSII